MTKAPRRRFLLLCCAVLAAAQGAALAQETAASARTLLNPLAAIDPQKLDGFLNRPLFSPTRRPPTPVQAAPVAAAAPAEAKAEPPAIRLVGIVRTPEGGIAQLTQDDDGRRFSVRVGDFLDDWAVASIEKSTLVLKQGDQEASFELFRGSAADAGKRQAAGESATQPDGTALEPSERRHRSMTKEDIKNFLGE